MAYISSILVLAMLYHILEDGDHPDPEIATDPFFVSGGAKIRTRKVIPHRELAYLRWIRC